MGYDSRSVSQKEKLNGTHVILVGFLLRSTFIMAISTARLSYPAGKVGIKKFFIKKGKRKRRAWWMNVS